MILPIPGAFPPPGTTVTVNEDTTGSGRRPAAERWDTMSVRTRARNAAVAAGLAGAAVLVLPGVARAESYQPVLGNDGRVASVCASVPPPSNPPYYWTANPRVFGASSDQPVRCPWGIVYWAVQAVG